MCIICNGIDNGTLSPWEAAKNRKEMLNEFDEEHLKVLHEKISNALLDYLSNLDKERVENIES